MAADKKTEKKKMIGSGFGATRLFLLLPMYWYIVYRILTALDLPQHVYAVFWVWAATAGIVALLELIVNAMWED